MSGSAASWSTTESTGPVMSGSSATCSTTESTGPAMSGSSAGSSSCSTCGRAPLAETVRERAFGRVMAPLASLDDRNNLGCVSRRSSSVHPRRTNHRVGVPTAQHPRVLSIGGVERVDPEQQVLRHHAIGRGAGFGAPRSLTQPSHVKPIYCCASRHAGLWSRPRHGESIPIPGNHDDVTVDRRAPCSTRLRETTRSCV